MKGTSVINYGDQVCLERLKILKCVFQKPRSLLVQSDWTNGFQIRIEIDFFFRNITKDF